MSVFERLNNDNGKNILRIFEEIEYHLEKYIGSVAGTEKDIKLVDDPLNRSISEVLKSFLVKKIPEYKLIVENNIELFENDDFAEILWNEVNYLKSIIVYDSANKLLNVFENTKSFISKFENIRLSIISLQNANVILEKNLEPKIKEIAQQVKNIEAAKQALENKKTEEIYSTASKNFLEAARIYEVLFYMLLCAAFLVTIISLSFFPYTQESEVNFILFKVLTLTLVITLGTLFLRKASHLRKLHEQSNQTSLELQALPIFLKNVERSEHSEIYKSLADKYFGKELDQTQNDKIGGMMTDHLTVGAELMKANAEMLKAKNDSKPANER